MASPMQKYLEHLIKESAEGAAGVQLQFKFDITGPKSGAIRLLEGYAGMFELMTVAQYGEGPNAVQSTISVAFEADMVAYVLFTPEATNMLDDRPRRGGFTTQ